MLDRRTERERDLHESVARSVPLAQQISRGPLYTNVRSRPLRLMLGSKAPFEEEFLEGMIEEGVARSLVRRMFGAAKLDILTFDEVKRDETATLQAVVVVAIVTVAQVVGAAGEGNQGVVWGMVPAYSGWFLWSGVAYLMGDKLFGGRATWRELLRVLGFAQAPSILGILGVMPGMAGRIGVMVGVWLLITGVVALRSVFGFGTGKAIITAVVGWIIAHIPIVIIHEIVG